MATTQPLTIGLTGGIGSGKTAISDYFAALGIVIIDADIIAHMLTTQGSPLLEQIKLYFGDWVIDDTGNYHRTAMKDYLTNNPDAIRQLNAITHPAIRHTIMQQLKAAQSAYVLLSVPLLFETRHSSPNLLSLCQHVLVVDIPTQLQIQRAAARGKQSITHIQTIIAQQVSRDERLVIAQSLGADIINNSGNLEDLHQQLAVLHQRYLAMADRYMCKQQSTSS